MSACLFPFLTEEGEKKHKRQWRDYFDNPAVLGDEDIDAVKRSRGDGENKEDFASLDSQATDRFEARSDVSHSSRQLNHFQHVCCDSSPHHSFFTHLLICLFFSTSSFWCGVASLVCLFSL